MAPFLLPENSDRGEGSHQTVERIPVDAYLVGYVLQRTGLRAHAFRQAKHDRNMDSLGNLVAIDQLKKRATGIVASLGHGHTSGRSDASPRYLRPERPHAGAGSFSFAGWHPHRHVGWFQRVLHDGG